MGIYIERVASSKMFHRHGMQSKSRKATELDTCLTWRLVMLTLYKHDFGVLKENYSLSTLRFI